jgi:hypothetical protein
MHVEINRAQHDGGADRAETLRAELNASLSIRAAALGMKL